MDESSLEIITALEAVKMAASLCENVRRDLGAKGSFVKQDRSPVTVADFGSQAVICKLIREKFPTDIIVAEEDSGELRKPDHLRILDQVAGYVDEFVPGSSKEDVCSWIDLRSDSVADRFWVLDPIDGTKGFLRGDQYAVALALVEYGTVRLGVMACPHLYLDKDHPEGKRGCIFFALGGKGSSQMNMDGDDRRALLVSRTGDPSEATFTESIDPEHSNHLIHQGLARRLNISKPSLRMDSQAKYGIVARGEATFYLRVPSSSEPGYSEKIWDHAAGSIIAEEAGGKVSDLLGRPLDFSSGIRMEKNHGVLVSNGILHEVILKGLET
jgi:3'(2'), 5'-bisphosphate nucleotidase